MEKTLTSNKYSNINKNQCFLIQELIYKSTNDNSLSVVILLIISNQFETMEITCNHVFLPL